jgi:hypothetical protein
MHFVHEETRYVPISIGSSSSGGGMQGCGGGSLSCNIGNDGSLVYVWPPANTKHNIKLNYNNPCRHATY